MSVLTVPLTSELSEKIEECIRHGRAANRADFARRALEHYLEHYIEEQAIFEVLLTVGNHDVYRRYRQ